MKTPESRLDSDTGPGALSSTPASRDTRSEEMDFPFRFI